MICEPLYSLEYSIQGASHHVILALLFFLILSDLFHLLYNAPMITNLQEKHQIGFKYTSNCCWSEMWSIVHTSPILRSEFSTSCSTLFSSSFPLLQSRQSLMPLLSSSWLRISSSQAYINHPNSKIREPQKILRTVQFQERRHESHAFSHLPYVSFECNSEAFDQSIYTENQGSYWLIIWLDSLHVTRGETSICWSNQQVFGMKINEVACKIHAHQNKWPSLVLLLDTSWWDATILHLAIPYFPFTVQVFQFLC